MLYRIKQILSVENNEPRTDGRYPLRVGCVGMVYALKPAMIFEYLRDNQGNEKTGYLMTSRVEKSEENETELYVKTVNSIYILEKLYAA